VAKKTGYPQYQESFNFRLEEQEMETCGIKVSSIQKLSFPEKGLPFFHFYSTLCESKLLKATLVVFFVLFSMILPGRESNPECHDRIPASNHMNTLTP